MEKVLVYGASGGIGSAIARALHARGMSLHLSGRSEETLSALADDLSASFTVADIADPAEHARIVAEAGTPLAGLVYAVGTITLKPLARLTVQDMLRDYELNAMGAALAVQAALPALKASSSPASVLLFSSVAVEQGFASHASISMAKGAVEGLVRALAAELAPKVRVNAIAPSLTRTPLAAPLTGSEQMAAAIAQMHAMGRLGVPEDIAALAALLVSPDSGWITGQVIGVDGGRSRLRTKG
ncbi:NAD(P)-dependent dehydrogenase, short-chain alcohol dehydrogenase family [Devosia enhydra]|uniref:NAD(P)-dependent dehydrogenase, short-chain alcohol dehydrogenase family n=1 Tax=Devosia enhydra TaxID=665118 RepID=A0A1K2I2Y0_9HYPH|nr:SDR family oxidoreductase [Devosia enhydra]SFZ86579.1 NAD(P)-dependent dehydrogenase, short-chain alcohol dehydrogenase family [Devosia enhydra]